MKQPRCLRPLWPAKRAARVALVATLALALFVGACAFLRISRPRDLEAYLGMASECHPVWKHFALRRFGPGDSAHELFRRFPPTSRSEFGRYGIYSFSLGPPGSISFTTVSVVTKDGKLLTAQSGSCTWQFTFFRTEDRGLDRQYAAFMQQRHRKVLQQRLERLERSLEKFYMQHERWPTNETEFSWFVTGEKPPPDKPAHGETPEEASFRVRYRLASSPPANPLGITLKLRDDGAMGIALIGEPDLTGVIAKPSKQSQEKP